MMVGQKSFIQMDNHENHSINRLYSFLDHAHRLSHRGRRESRLFDSSRSPICAGVDPDIASHESQTGAHRMGSFHGLAGKHLRSIGQPDRVWTFLCVHRSRFTGRFQIPLLFRCGMAIPPHLGLYSARIAGTLH